MTGCKQDRLVTAVVVTALSLGLISEASPADATDAIDQQSRCAQGERWDIGMNMCMPNPNAAEPTTVLAGQFNAFGVFSALQGPRGVDQFAAPNWFMLDAGRNIGARQFINIELMGTAELWTYPWHGYPELLQVGEQRSDGSAYVDAQHPHSSPIMGLTLSDTISLTGARSLRLYFAPRGESTDGPVVYMHRASARDNPDAPLGHHVAQDVGHISSTVLAAQLSSGKWIIEASVFNGTEPEPTHVNLPIGPLNSGAMRLTYVMNTEHRVSTSVAHIDQVDPAYPGTTSATRLSASIYDQFALGGPWQVDHSFILGSIRRHPDGATLTSFLDEVTLAHGPAELWGRLELLQRLNSELGIPSSPMATGTAGRRWVSALTVGYTHWFPGRHHVDFAIGSSLTADVIQKPWAMAYGSQVPLTVRLIFQVRGTRNWRFASGMAVH
jgi:hypothetical protein